MGEPKSPIQRMDPAAKALMLSFNAQAPGANTGKAQTLVTFNGISPDDFTASDRQWIQTVIDKHKLTEILKIIDRDGCALLVDRATAGRRAECNLSLDDEASGSFDDDLVPGEFINELMVTLAVINDPLSATDPQVGELFIDFARKGYVLWADPEDDDFLPYTWADVRTLLTL